MCCVRGGGGGGGGGGCVCLFVVVETVCLSLSLSTLGSCLAVTLSLLLFLFLVLSPHRLVGLVVKGVRLESGRSRVRIPLAPGFFRGRVIPVTKKLALQWLPCQAPGVLGSVLGLVGLVSVYCDWVRWKVGSATSISVWQHVKLSEQIGP